MLGASHLCEGVDVGVVGESHVDTRVGSRVVLNLVDVFGRLVFGHCISG